MKPLYRTAAAILALSLAANAQEAPVPQVPDSIKAPAGETLILQAHATGFQIYTCQAGSDGKLSWSLKAPAADLFDSQNTLIGHHSSGPTWKHKDGSAVTANMTASADSPDRNAIPWLLLTATSHTGDGVLSRVTTIQGIHTKGGQAPSPDQCDASHHGIEAKAPYTADYYFYVPSK